jgi:hypothetical protein
MERDREWMLLSEEGGEGEEGGGEIGDGNRK